jgi:hypothetical protein
MSISIHKLDDDDIPMMGALPIIIIAMFGSLEDEGRHET